jgi:hypothetical protein
VESGRRPDLVYGRRRDDLVRWTNQEPDRFYISQAYESPKRRFRYDEPSGFSYLFWLATQQSLPLCLCRRLVYLDR